MATFTGSPFQGIILGTNKADLFSGEVTGNATVYGALNAEIYAGNGMDTIRLMGKASASGVGYGAYNSTVDGDNGDDIINISGTVSDAVSFKDFSSPASDLIKINGNAEFTNDILQLTPDLGGQVGSAFFSTPFQLDSDTSFSTQFQFRIDGQRAGTTEGGDGLVFMIQNDPRDTSAIGRDGSGLGYGGDGNFGGDPIANSVAIAFDTFPYQLNNQGSVQILQNGSNSPLSESVLPFNFASGNPLNAWVDYNGKTDLLEVYLSQDINKPSSPVLSYTTILTNTVGSQGLFGFSASTGARFNTHDIENWQLQLEGNKTVGQGIGAYESSVHGGNGNDTMNISGTNFGIQNGLISGGNGDDTLNVGTGQGTVDGGSGTDLLIINYLNFDSNNKPTNVIVSADASGNVLISGTTDSLGNSYDTNGNSNAWTQTIKRIEQFSVNDNTYTASEFISSFG